MTLIAAISARARELREGVVLAVLPLRQDGPCHGMRLPLPLCAAGPGRVRGERPSGRSADGSDGGAIGAKAIAPTYEPEGLYSPRGRYHGEGRRWG